MIGAIADDLTGAADLAGGLAREGVATSLLVGVPRNAYPVPDAQAIVVGLKIRTASAERAVADAVESARWLLATGVRRLIWKICSTFDSTPAGNIGPVADALLDLLGARITVVCPAFPRNGRVVRDGRLFVHGVALDESPMRDHPLTPMRDSRLERLLAPQVRTPEAIGGVDLATTRDGATAIEAELERLGDDGIRYAIVDAESEDDAAAVGRAASTLPLTTAAAGLTAGLVAGLRTRRELPDPLPPAALRPIDGPALIVAGSASAATRAQIARFAAHSPAVRLDPLAPDPVGDATAAARSAFGTGAPAVLVHSAADARAVNEAAARLGHAAGAIVEDGLGRVAAAIRDDGVRRFVVAGGETTGAVLTALAVRELRIGPEIAPGVPVVESVGEPRLLIVPKSGNFGGPAFFDQAVAATAPAHARRDDG